MRPAPTASRAHICDPGGPRELQYLGERLRERCIICGIPILGGSKPSLSRGRILHVPKRPKLRAEGVGRQRGGYRAGMKTHEKGQAPPQQAQGAESDTTSMGLAASPVPREVARDFLYAFLAYVKSRKIYPPGHARPTRQLALWFQCAEAILKRTEEIGVFVTHDFIAVSGAKFGIEERIAAEFVPELIKRLIRFIAIERGVTLEGLEALAEPIAVDPEVLKGRGGASVCVAARRQKHILFIEFDYDMESAVEREEDIRIVRKLARFEQGTDREQYVLRRMSELRVGPNDRRWLEAALRHPEIKKRLSSLSKLLAKPNDKAQTKMCTADFVLYLVKQLSGGEDEVGQAREADGIAVVTELLDRLRARVRPAVRDPDPRASGEVFEKLAAQMMSSPDSLIRSLGNDPDSGISELAEEPFQLLQVIFRRAEDAGGKVSFGGEVLEKVEAPADPVEASDPEPQKPAIQPKVGTAIVARAFAELKQRLGGSRLRLRFDAVAFAHLDVLLELLHQEKKAALRGRIVQELQTFLDGMLARGLGQRRLVLAPRLLGEGSPLAEEELQQVVAAPAVLRQVLAEYLNGGDSWRPILEGAVLRDRRGVAAALGRVLLAADHAIPVGSLGELIKPFQEELVDWIEQRFADQASPPSPQRIIPIAMACRSVRVVSLVSRLLDKVGPNERLLLMRTMVEIDETRAVGAMSLQLNEVAGETRLAIIGMLEGIGHPLAQDALIEVAVAPDWRGDRLEQRLAALQALGRSGSEKSVEVLRRLSRSWPLLLTAARRRVRKGAAEALCELRKRLQAEGA